MLLLKKLKICILLLKRKNYDYYPEILEALILNAGYPAKALDKTLARRLMAYTLIHRYIDLASVLSVVPQAREAANMDELTQLVWPLQRNEEKHG